MAVPGVLAVFTGADALADGIKPIPHNTTPSSPPDIALDNRDAELKSGMFVRASFPRRDRREALVVPATSLVRRGQLDGLAVLVDRRRRCVWKGGRTGQQQRASRARSTGSTAALTSRCSWKNLPAGLSTTSRST